MEQTTPTTQKTYKIGFTGTSRGMTDRQKEFVTHAIWEYEGQTELHHGDCIGADEQMYFIATTMKPDIDIVIHPCILSKMRAYCTGQNVILVHNARDPLARNRDIVDSVDILWACPYQMSEVKRSGTWMTVRYARSVDKPMLVILPDGSIL